MSYKIHYGSGAAIKQTIVEKSHNLIGKMVFISAIILILSITFFGRQNVIDFFIPGNPEVTKTAWEEMVNKLESGSDIGQAVTVFCQSILNNEKTE